MYISQQMTYSGHTKCENDVMHQFCGLNTFKIVENTDILPRKNLKYTKTFFIFATKMGYTEKSYFHP